MSWTPHEHHDEATDAGPMGARRRRLDRVLRDLGLTSILGDDWAEVHERGAEFASISGGQLDRLMTHLEDLRDNTEPTPTWRLPGQYTLDLDPVAGPTPMTLEPVGHLNRSARCSG